MKFSFRKKYDFLKMKYERGEKERGKRDKVARDYLLNPSMCDPEGDYKT